MPPGAARCTSGCTRRFTNYWTRKGIKLHEPEFPLVAIVFNSRRAYADFAQAELGTAAESIVGYYSLRTNRITMYDLTGVESLRGRRTIAAVERAQINRMLAQPEAEQVGGHDRPRGHAPDRLQQRTANSLCRHSAVGQRRAGRVFRNARPAKRPRLADGIGEVNAGRLAQFRQYLTQRRPTVRSNR